MPSDRVRFPVEFVLLGDRPSTLSCPECGYRMIVVSYVLTVGAVPLVPTEATACGSCEFVVTGATP